MLICLLCIERERKVRDTPDMTFMATVFKPKKDKIIYTYIYI